MNQLMVMNNEVTMSSREIAELVGKEHKHVMRELRVLSEQLGDMFEGVVQVWTTPSNISPSCSLRTRRSRITCLCSLPTNSAISRLLMVTSLFISIS